MSISKRCRVMSIGLCAATFITLSRSLEPAIAQARIGAPAPAFALTDSNGRTLSLPTSTARPLSSNGRATIVGTLEALPRQQYQALQKKWTGEGVVWLSVISSMELPKSRKAVPEIYRIPATADFPDDELLCRNKVESTSSRKNRSVTWYHWRMV